MIQKYLSKKQWNALRHNVENHLGKKTNRTSCIQTVYPQYLPKAAKKVSKGLKMTSKMNPKWYFLAPTAHTGPHPGAASRK